MQIYGPTHAHTSQAVNAPHSNKNGQVKGNQAAAPASDKLDISPAAEAAVQAAEQGESRQELVARIRSEIADGTYETSGKLDQALDSFLDEVG